MPPNSSTPIVMRSSRKPIMAWRPKSLWECFAGGRLLDDELARFSSQKLAKLDARSSDLPAHGGSSTNAARSSAPACCASRKRGIGQARSQAIGRAICECFASQGERRRGVDRRSAKNSSRLVSQFWGEYQTTRRKIRPSPVDHRTLGQGVRCGEDIRSGPLGPAGPHDGDSLTDARG